MKTETGHDENELFCRQRLGIQNAKGELARRLRLLSPPLTQEELLSLPLNQGRFLVVDLETTGMNPKKAAVIEVAAVEVDGFLLGREFSTLVKPRASIPRFITSLTGINELMVKDAPPMAAVQPLLARMMEKRVIAAHNLSFDLAFIKEAFARLNQEPPSAAGLCTVKLSRRAFPELPSHNLDSVAAHLGLRAETKGPGARHRALGDARMAAAILVKICMMARGEGVETVGDLLAWQSRKARKRKKPQAKNLPAASQ